MTPLTDTNHDPSAEDSFFRHTYEIQNKEALLASAARALDAWDLRVTGIDLVSHSENIVFRVDTESGQAFVFRFHRPCYHSLPELQAELKWVAALNQAGIGAPVPRLAKDGRAFVSVHLPELSQTRYASLVEWVEGVALATMIEQETDKSNLVSYFHKAGQLAARIHNHAMTWPLPPGFQRHAFDADGLIGVKPFWGPFWEQPKLTAGERGQIIHARKLIYRILTDYGKGRGTYSLIHADLHPDNLIITGDNVHIIDFDDAGFGWHQYELAVAIFYYQDTPFFDTIREAIVAGYLTLRPLSKNDIDLLPIFVLIRSMVLLGWIEQRPELDNSHQLPVLIDRACEQSKSLFGSV